MTIKAIYRGSDKLFSYSISYQLSVSEYFHEQVRVGIKCCQTGKEKFYYCIMDFLKEWSNIEHI